jgi:hypothetical protein
MPITRITSGGQTGADQGALDAAIGLGVDHGGWIPGGRGSDAGFLDPERYGLTVMESTGYNNYAQCREHNVMDADGALVLFWEDPFGPPAMVSRLARKHRKPFFHLDLSTTGAEAAIREIHGWACGHDIGTLTVAGPRECRNTDIYAATRRVVEGILLLARERAIAQRGSAEREQEETALPHTVDEAVAFLLKHMPLKDKSVIANMSASELPGLDASIGAYIRRRFDLQTSSNPLRAACAFTAGKTAIDENEACMVILQELAYRLHRTHRLRVVR